MQIYRQPSQSPDSVGFEFLDCSYSQIVDSFSTAASFSFINMKNMQIHERIRTKRAEAKLSVQAFADALGVTRAAVNQWEKEGGTAPSRKHQPKVAKMLGISVAELMSESGQQNPPLAHVDTGVTATNTVAEKQLSVFALAIGRLFDQLTDRQKSKLFGEITGTISDELNPPKSAPSKRPKSVANRGKQHA